ncbi:hypothetical protein ACFLS1_00420 [Verrucomicrobiota bacterium]
MNEKKITPFEKYGLGVAAAVFFGTVVFCCFSVIRTMRSSGQKEYTVSETTVSADTIKSTEYNRPSVGAVTVSRVRQPEKHSEQASDDYQFRLNLSAHLRKQSEELRAEAEVLQDTEEKRSLALTEEEAESLEESGNMIY